MKLNGSIYAVDFTSHTDAEFSGTHPALAIQNSNQPDLYYVIPFTTYTQNRWEKYKRKLAVKVNSCNSIALVHKMQIKPICDIQNRYIANNVLLNINTEELKNICQKLELLINKSTNKALKSHVKVQSELNEIETELTKHISGEPSDFTFNVNNPNNITYSKPVRSALINEIRMIVKRINPEARISINNKVLTINLNFFIDKSAKK